MEMVVVVIVAALGGIVAYLNLRGRYRRRRQALGYDSGPQTRPADDAARGDRAPDTGSGDGGGDGGGA